jgi:YegS/Rv2252/BmrU family lipid kinase
VENLKFSAYECICAIGGDGTLHEIINGMLHRADGRRLPLGVIAGGTGNSFMRSMGCLDPLEAARRIVCQEKKNLDIVKVKAAGKTIYGFNIVGWGLPADISILAERLRIFGRQRYNIASIIQLLKYKQRIVRVGIDDAEINGDYGLILGCNTVYAGNGMKMAPEARIDDGLIDLLLVANVGRMKLIKLFGKIFNGDHVHDPVVAYYQVKRFTIASDVQQCLNIDGEIVGETPVQVEVMPGEIEVFV